MAPFKAIPLSRPDALLAEACDLLFSTGVPYIKWDPIPVKPLGPTTPPMTPQADAESNLLSESTQPEPPAHNCLGCAVPKGSCIITSTLSMTLLFLFMGVNSPSSVPLLGGCRWSPFPIHGRYELDPLSQELNIPPFSYPPPPDHRGQRVTTGSYQNEWPSS